MQLSILAIVLGLSSMTVADDITDASCNVNTNVCYKNGDNAQMAICVGSPCTGNSRQCTITSVAPVVGVPEGGSATCT
ncbi:Uu.00g133580.m01.CDS01 [Anthostomella pinea]|uniref:Uu.00g133580.m01.CDS01 n=1 Tax=Anthostomella pinea TaxID=933095 RepID=A0AAI8VPG2_9PEZI|nr:Uu.00g133580.m01.CDS01 [Anthostomella pinea]